MKIKCMNRTKILLLLITLIASKVFQPNKKTARKY